MRAMILAAGQGTRMGALTQHTPKPLLRIGDAYLIEYALRKLKESGITEVVINISHHAEKIKAALGDGTRYGLTIHYSFEPERLETGGGIYQALPFLGDQPFLVMSADIITDYPLAKLLSRPIELAHLIMVPNPSYHLNGDFALTDEIIDLHSMPRFTFGNIGVYHPKLFTACQSGYFRLADVLKPAILAKKVSGELYTGNWHNIGTPEDIQSFKSF